MPTLIAAIFVTGGLGALARLSCQILGKKITLDFPIGTVAANILAAFCIGIVMPLEMPFELKAVIASGFIGSLGTLSSICSDMFLLIKDREFLRALLYVVCTVCLGYLAFTLGKTCGGLF
ncbi:FluC/FEX family fluoride channel [Succinatimonas hippei]|uniref:Fluoride-specific ion channel FluC n=1 Tax=Succinatimonas hippei (strain DSM 22608 / JCM 16073 / KCTC 15190 / YIT 12066) TaxID=762983 RepID=E8LIF8_SUCHY|nr:CrcB family protein [Succinatimonas hippei]EFY07685.1 putative protein CrcB [Succinatimonas hippei YIT 12066]MCL1602492.1 CrcB family protein [Succinatimonas hippei]MDM8119702.1 CrcB family protein [Succinatimonas hippei]